MTNLSSAPYGPWSPEGTEVRCGEDRYRAEEPAWKYRGRGGRDARGRRRVSGRWRPRVSSDTSTCRSSRCPREIRARQTGRGSRLCSQPGRGGRRGSTCVCGTRAGMIRLNEDKPPRAMRCSAERRPGRLASGRENPAPLNSQKHRRFELGFRYFRTGSESAGCPLLTTPPRGQQPGSASGPIASADDPGPPGRDGGTRGPRQ
jgi:hypothetical protein